MSNGIINEEVYPLNLLEALAEGEWEDAVPDDIEGTLEYVFYTLKERERLVVNLRYKEKKTYVEIGKLLGICTERVRQIDCMAIRKLRKPQRYMLIKLGVKAAITSSTAAARESEFSQRMESAMISIEGIADMLGTILGNSDMKQVSNMCSKYNLRKNLESLGLSVRTYNCLSRAGVKTLEDIVKMNPAELRKIRNLGPQSYNEVAMRIHEKGLCLAGEKSMK
ncbi:MAG: DNA-directed RNA polymerase subunit alpha C-terminal domain-containing protein [bacterium]|nr:DNA-directed RNA polymerase subunit alpha C-terminal domain-containing protein [bacterium]